MAVGYWIEGKGYVKCAGNYSAGVEEETIEEMKAELATTIKEKDDLSEEQINALFT